VADSTAVYAPWAPLIMMVTALMMQLIEFLATEVVRKRNKHSPDNTIGSDDLERFPKNPATPAMMSLDNHGHHHHHDHQAINTANDPHANYGSVECTAAATAPGSRPRCDSTFPTHTDCTESAISVQNPEILTSHCNVESITGVPVHHHTGHHCHTDPVFLLDSSQLTAQQRLATYVLEFGIALHSILIGLALGTTAGTDFLALFIAIIFHQFFEGLALGQRIGQVTPKHKLVRGLVMASIYALTTPLGIALGIGIYTSFSPSSPAFLLVSGTLDAMAAGILLYTAFVHLLGADFVDNDEFANMRARHKVLAFGCLYAGAAVMAIIGKWA